MAALFGKYTVIAILTCSSWLSKASLDELSEESTYDGDKECHGKVGSKSADAMLQTKSFLQGERFDDAGAGPEENKLPSAVKVGEGMCLETRPDSNLGGWLDGTEYIRPPHITIGGPITASECEMAARTHSDALGFSFYFYSTWGYGKKSSCSIFLPDCEDESDSCVNATCRIDGGSRCWHSYDYYYSFVHPDAPGPYQIDRAVWTYYAYSTCYTFEDSTADFVITQNHYTCEEANGLLPISSKEACQAAGDALGLGLSVKEKPSPKDPVGCFIVGTTCKHGDECHNQYNPGALRWSSDVGTTEWTRKKRNVICKAIKKGM